MSSPPAGATHARLRPWTFAALAAFDVVVYFDWALRWEHGFGLLGRGEWWRWTALVFGAWLACLGWLVREGAGFVRHALLTFPTFNGGFFVAGIGNPSHDWAALLLLGAMTTARLIEGVGIPIPAPGLGALRTGLSSAAFSMGAALCITAVTLIVRGKRSRRIGA